MKKTLSFRILSLLFALVFLVTALPLGIFANDTETTEEKAVANEELTATESEGGSLLPTGYEPEPSFVTEVTELRTENVKHFDNGDGTYEAVSYGTAVHRKDADGKWQDIDNTLTLREDRGAERYVSSDARISFAPVTSGDGAIWSLSENGYSVSLSLSEADLRAGAGADVRNHATRAEQVAAAKKADDREAVLRVDNSTSIVYRNVLANVDLEYILSGNDVKETILVQNVCENYDYSFKLSLSGLIPKTTDDGAILLCDAESGEEIYLLPAPYMTDANDEYSDAVSYRLTELGEGEYEIVVSASDEWINAPERAFPVVIDPTMASPGSSSADTYVNSATNYINQNNGDKQFAWISDEKTTLIKSVGMPELPQGATIINGRLKFAYYFADGATTGSMTITAHRATRDWVECDTNGVTWYSLSLNGTDPTLGLTSAISGAELMAASSYPQWAEINITSAVQFWYNGSNLAVAYNYGIGLKRSSGKTLVNLRTKEYNSGAYAPYFTVSYRLFDGVYSIRRTESNYYLGTDAKYYSASVFQWSIPSPPNSDDLRSYLFKVEYCPTLDGFVIRSMKNNQFYLYHRVSDHTVKVGGYTVNGVPVDDEDLPQNYIWKIGNAPGGYDNRIWNVWGGQTYFLHSSTNGNGITTSLTTSAATDWTEWDFCAYTAGIPLRGFFSLQSSIESTIVGEIVDFDYYTYDERVGFNDPIAYSITDLFGQTTYSASIDPLTGVFTSNATGYYLLHFSYYSETVLYQTITVEECLNGVHYIRNRNYGRYLQIDQEDAPGYCNNGGFMEIQTLNGEEYQRWVFTYLGTGFYSITSPISNYAITVPTGEEESIDVNLILKPYTGTDNQKWSITTTSGSGVKIKAKSSYNYHEKDLVMDLESLGLFQSINGLKVQQREYVLNDSYCDEWIVTTSVVFENYYDSTFVGNNTYINNIFIANGFANRVYSQLCGIKFKMQGGPTQLLSAYADQCSHGPNEPCSNSDCGQSCLNHHKNCYHISTQLYDSSLTNTIRVLWSDRDEDTYCDKVNGSHQTVNQLAFVYDHRPAINFTLIAGDDDETRAACMFLVLVHEIAHTFGMYEAYEDPDHGVNNGFICVMEHFEPTYAWCYYQNILDGYSAPFCDSCKNDVIKYCLNALSYN